MGHYLIAKVNAGQAEIIVNHATTETEDGRWMLPGTSAGEVDFNRSDLTSIPSRGFASSTEWDEFFSLRLLLGEVLHTLGHGTAPFSTIYRRIGEISYHPFCGICFSSM